MAYREINPPKLYPKMENLVTFLVRSASISSIVWYIYTDLLMKWIYSHGRVTCLFDCPLGTPIEPIISVRFGVGLYSQSDEFGISLAFGEPVSYGFFNYLDVVGIAPHAMDDR